MHAQGRKPDWLISLGTENGIASFQSENGIELPPEILEYYASVWASCFLYSYWEVDAFLEDLDNIGEAFPPLVTWEGDRHVVVGYFVHGDCVCAVNVDSTPTINWGAFAKPFDYEPVRFSNWISGAIERQLQSSDLSQQKGDT